VEEPLSIVPSSPPASILERFDPETVSEEARRESRNREVHLPPLSTFRWWARRTGAVNAAVLRAGREALGRPVLDVLDPFAGGGTIPLVALREGHRVQARDINPWAAMGIERMLDLPDPADLEAAHDVLGELAADFLRDAYATEMSNGSPGTIAHTFRVAVGRCTDCGAAQRQFPYSLLTLLQRRERKRPEAILACPAGHVFEGREGSRQECPKCERKTDPAAFYTSKRLIECAHCGHSDRLSDRVEAEPWNWEVVLVERAGEDGREFSVPTETEIKQAERGWQPTGRLGPIPEGAETKVLLRHGFERWEDLYPDRQRAVTETLLGLAEEASEDARVTATLRMAIIGTAEFAGFLSRWDRFYLKCNDATAGHRFNFSTFVPELNVWGAGDIGRGTVTRRVRSLSKAAEWFHENVADEHEVTVTCGDSAALENQGDIDVVLTDPPYHDDVHYGELSLLFRGWAGLSMEPLEGEAASNAAAGLNADGEAYGRALVPVFRACHRALRPGGRLVFSYANHEPGAWVALFGALQSAGFTAVSCVSVHSENETDFAKRGIRSCTDDLLMELSPTPLERPAVRGGAVPGGEYMDAVTRLFLRVGCLGDDWEVDALQSLRVARSVELAAEAAAAEANGEVA
jgi:adenine-specific DNA methylase